MTKIFLNDEPLMSPGKCANCGASGRDRKYVDFGLTVELYGVVYICSICVGELFRLFNFEPVATNLKFKTLQSHVTVLETSKMEVDNALTRFGDKVETLRRELAHIHNVVSNSSGSTTGNIDPDEVLDSSSREVDNAIDNSRVENDSTKPRKSNKSATKSATGSGRPNVPSLAELLNTNKPPD